MYVWARLDEARDVAVRLRAITPVVVRRAEDREFYLSGLRLAAGEEPSELVHLAIAGGVPPSSG